MVVKNDIEAMNWYRLAAAQGEPNAQRNLGIMYEFGTVEEPSFDEAIKWYKLAADQGDLEAKLYMDELVKKLSFSIDSSKAPQVDRSLLYKAPATQKNVSTSPNTALNSTGIIDPVASQSNVEEAVQTSNSDVNATNADSE